MQEYGNGGDDDQKRSDDNDEKSPQRRQAFRVLQRQLSPYSNVVAWVRPVNIDDLLAARRLFYCARVLGQSVDQVLAVEAWNGEDGERILFYPSTSIVEIPGRVVDFGGFRAKVVGLVEDETSDCVEPRGFKVSLGTLLLEKGSDGD
jgi:hypothetical protein